MWKNFFPPCQMRGAELRDVRCFAWLHWKLVCLWQFNSCFRFAVAASEIVTVISSNFSFISFWRSFRGVVWEVLWTLILTQSQVGIVGLKIVNSLNRINRCVRFRKRNRLLVTFVVFFYRFVDFLTLNTLTQLYLKNLYTFRTNIASRSYQIIKGLALTVIRIWLCVGQRSLFFAHF